MPETLIARRTKLREMWQETDANVKKLLNDEQYAQYRKLRQQQSALLRRS